MSFRPLAFVAPFALALVACTPSPEKTCEKLKEIGEKDTTYIIENGAPFQLDMSKCLTNMNEMKQRDPEAYKCTAKVIAKLTNLDTAILAMSICDKNRPKKSTKTSDDD